MNMNRRRIRMLMTTVFLVAANAALPVFGDKLAPAPSCDVIPNDGLEKLTNDRFYFASELHDQLAAKPSSSSCDWLHCFFADIANSHHSNATLVFDQLCVLNRPLIVPGRFTLAGVGIQGEGALSFQGLPPQSAALFIRNAYTTVRDLAISYNGYGSGVTGINVSNTEQVSIKNIRLQDFAIGVHASHALYSSVERSNISTNGINLILGEESSSWRVRDNVMSRALKWSVLIDSTSAQEHVISGNRFECNGHDDFTLDGSACHNNPVDAGGGAIKNNGTAVQITHNRFEGNNADSTTSDDVNADRDIVIGSNAELTRIISNDIGGLVTNDGLHTKCALNIRRSTPNITGC